MNVHIAFAFLKNEYNGRYMDPSYERGCYRIDLYFVLIGYRHRELVLNTFISNELNSTQLNWTEMKVAVVNN